MVASEIEARPTRLLPVAGGILALAAAMGIGRFAYTPVLPAMQRTAHFTTAQAGLLAAANYAGYLAGALLIVVAVPVSARRAVLLGGLVAIVAITALMAVATGLLFWGIVRFASGLESAGVFVRTSSLVPDALRHGEPDIRHTDVGLEVARHRRDGHLPSLRHVPVVVPRVAVEDAAVVLGREALGGGEVAQGSPGVDGGGEGNSGRDADSAQGEVPDGRLVTHLPRVAPRSIATLLGRSCVRRSARLFL